MPPDSPQGQYRVLVHDNGTQNFQGTFLVHEYQLEPIRLVVDTGDPAAESITAASRSRAPSAPSSTTAPPVVGREIRYQLSGDRFETATTDAKGEVKIKLDTREYSESQVLPLVGANARGQRQHASQFHPRRARFYHRREHRAAGLRDGRVAGGHRQRPRRGEQAAGAEAYAQGAGANLVNGRVGERPVEEHELTTAADGKARQTLKLDKGGVYFLRAEAIDRFKNPISGQAAVQISGEDDLVRLRILADKHTYKVGDTAAVELFWREAPALALVTYQGARVLDYRLVELKTGANKLEIPMTAALAPNFELAVAVMTDPEQP